uniref:Uncharacterized protein n=1 Tax=Fundulus heteroclitus TaxID=8078 RepID=A0A3Q2UJJ2_FUNHE
KKNFNVNFIRTYFYDAVYSAEPKDIIQAVTDRPYCVYLYVGVELGPGRSASVLLIGYFDERSCEQAVTLLHTMARVADSDAWLLVEALRKYELPLSNLAAFYCSAPEPGLSRVFVSRLQAFRPKLLSLCSVPGIGERACQAGFTASFSHAVDLVRDVHRHYSTCLSVNDSLKEVFADAGRRGPPPPVSPQCSFIVRSVQKMAARWQDLQEYFKSLEETDAVNRIRKRLTDDVVRLQFVFLSYALEPLRVLLEQQESDSADLSTELHLTSVLLQLYTDSVYQPAAVHRFLLNREVDLLHGEDLLPVDEVNVGADASSFMWAHGPKLGQQNTRRLRRDAQSFYRAALQSLVESLPGPLGDVTLRNIGLVTFQEAPLAAQR